MSCPMYHVSCWYRGREGEGSVLHIRCPVGREGEGSVLHIRCPMYHVSCQYRGREGEGLSYI